MSLSRLWQQQGQDTDAYQVLAPIYGWFTEGFDTVDMQDAKAFSKRWRAVGEGGSVTTVCMAARMSGVKRGRY